MTFSITYSVCYNIEADSLDEAVNKANIASEYDSFDRADIQAITWEDDNGYHIEQY